MCKSRRQHLDGHSTTPVLKSQGWVKPAVKAVSNGNTSYTMTYMCICSFCHVVSCEPVLRQNQNQIMSILNLFQARLGVDKKEFFTYPRWKQIEIRKEKGLFWGFILLEIRRNKKDKKGKFAYFPFVFAQSTLLAQTLWWKKNIFFLQRREKHRLFPHTYTIYPCTYFSYKNIETFHIQEQQLFFTFTRHYLKDFFHQQNFFNQTLPKNIYEYSEIPDQLSSNAFNCSMT